MSTTYLDMMKLTRCEVELHAELAAAVTHPLADYAPGSPRLERLRERMALAQRFTSGNGQVNL